MEKGTCNDYDIIMTSEVELKGYTFHTYMLSIIVALRGKS